MIQVGLLYMKNDQFKSKKKYSLVDQKLLIPYLKSIGIKKLDYLIITHGDYDHMGEANNLVKNFKEN